MSTFVVGLLSGVASTLIVTWLLNEVESRRVVPETACALLQEFDTNRRIFERKHQIVTEVILEFTESGRKDVLSELQDLKFQNFVTGSYDTRKYKLALFPVEASKHIEGLYTIMHHVEMNEPALIDTILRQPGRATYHLRALAEPYALFERIISPSTGKSLRSLCYKNQFVE
jgi:hypothetical protein